MGPSRSPDHHHASAKFSSRACGGSSWGKISDFGMPCCQQPAGHHASVSDVTSPSGAPELGDLARDFVSSGKVTRKVVLRPAKILLMMRNALLQATIPSCRSSPGFLHFRAFLLFPAATRLFCGLLFEERIAPKEALEMLLFRLQRGNAFLLSVKRSPCAGWLPLGAPQSLAAIEAHVTQ